MRDLGTKDAIASRDLGEVGVRSRLDLRVLFGFASAVVLVHLLTNGRYGIHRDELQVLSDARHLDWGFVPYPPFTPFVERIGLELFGVSLVGLRLFSVIAQAIVLVVTGLMTWEVGGESLAQFAAVLSVALSGLQMFEGTEFQYTSFDYLWWVLIAYFVIRLLKSDNPRWWLAIGVVAGLGFQTKYTMAFYVVGILGGLLLTRSRRHLITPWFWAGAGVAFLIFLPNLIWQLRHDLISLHFLENIHVRDVGEGRAQWFLVDQFKICTNLFSAPLWIVGLICFLRSPRYRILAWMYLIPLALFWLGKGRGYYLGAAYPMLIAMGATEGERWVRSLSTLWRRVVEFAYFAGVLAHGAFICAVVLPIASSGPLKDFALKNNGDLREEIGWDELVKSVAAVRDSLPADQRQNNGVLLGNYGEQGAIEIFGPAYHLPPPISLTNSAWLRGYPTPPPSALIVIGWSRHQVDEAFTSCSLAGHIGNSLGIHNEESESHQDIFVCGPPRLPWPEFWKEHQRFG